MQHHVSGAFLLHAQDLRRSGEVARRVNSEEVHMMTKFRDKVLLSCAWANKGACEEERRKRGHGQRRPTRGGGNTRQATGGEATAHGGQQGSPLLGIAITFWQSHSRNPASNKETCTLLKSHAPRDAFVVLSTRFFLFILLEPYFCYLLQSKKNGENMTAFVIMMS